MHAASGQTCWKLKRTRCLKVPFYDISQWHQEMSDISTSHSYKMFTAIPIFDIFFLFPVIKSQSQWCKYHFPRTNRPILVSILPLLFVAVFYLSRLQCSHPCKGNFAHIQNSVISPVKINYTHLEYRGWTVRNNENSINDLRIKPRLRWWAKY